MKCGFEERQEKVNFDFPRYETFSLIPSIGLR